MTTQQLRRLGLRRLGFGAVAVAALAGGGAQARECHGITFPDQAQVDGSTLTLNGLGARLATMFSVHVYIGALYVARPSADPAALMAMNAPAELALQFLRDVGADDIRGAWREGFANNAAANLPALQARIGTLNAAMSDISSGQRMVFRFRPGSGVHVTVAGADRGTIPGDDFAHAFLSVFLGPRPANPELKAGLLGGACS